MLKVIALDMLVCMYFKNNMEMGGRDRVERKKVETWCEESPVNFSL